MAPPLRRPAVLVAALALLIPAASAHAAPAGAGPAPGPVRVCPAPVRADEATCDTTALAAPAATPEGWGAKDLQAAYRLQERAADAPGALVAVVVPYGNPAAESDLNAYRAQFGLPACRAADGCFTRLSQRGLGGADLPAPPSSPDKQHWTLESAIDVEMVSAICPTCRILLVEADTDLFSNLLLATDTATARAKFVSISWSRAETADESASEPHFDRPGVVIAVATGDHGHDDAVQYPGTSRYVVAVGGTTLTRTGTGWSESAWSGAGSACSLGVPRPPWQPALGGCATRATADVSAVADNIAIYDGGWLRAGGTSAAAPIVAATFALADPPRPADRPASYLYANAAGLHDVVTGGNGSCAGALCHAGPGWDGPTGLGSPASVDAFAWHAPLALTVPAQTSVQGTPVGLDLKAYSSGGIAPYQYFPALGATLPPGLSVDRDTGLVTGTPTTPGTYPVVVEILDSGPTGNLKETTFTWTVKPATVVVPKITGLTYNDASLALNRAGLVMGLENDVTVDCDSADVGRLTYQDPAAGRVVVKGTSVNFNFGVRPSGNSHCR